MESDRGKDYQISPDKIVRITEFAVTGDIEIKDMARKIITNYGVKKLNKDEYLIIKTGEVRKYKKNPNKRDEELERTMRNLKYMLKNNFYGERNEFFITLTSRDDVQNIRDIKKMFKSFWRKLKAKYANSEFVAVFEKNSDNSSWHIHMIVKFVNHKTLKISNKEIEKIWCYGFTKTSRITDEVKINDINESKRIIYKDNFTENFGIDRVINYLCKKKTKENIPIGERCYAASRGIKKPKKIDKEYGTILKEMGQDYILNKEYTSLIRDSRNNKIVNKVKTEIWKKKKDQ